MRFFFAFHRKLETFTHLLLVNALPALYNAKAMSDEFVSGPAPPEWGAPSAPSAGKRILNILGEFLQTLLIAGVLFLIVNQITSRIRVDGSSMEPSLHDGEFVVVNRLAYNQDDPQRGDVIVFRYPLDPSRRFIKRVIGLPGDVIEIGDGKVYINDQLVHEPYIAAPPRYTGTWTVSIGEVFVLGDNRNNSSDSQNWGNLDQDEIIGKANLVYWPLDEIGVIPHYDLVVSAAE